MVPLFYQLIVMLCCRRFARALFYSRKLTSFRPHQPFSTVTPLAINPSKTDQNLSSRNVDPTTQKRLVLSAYKFIRYYELRGHELSNVDPLSKLTYMQSSKTTRSSGKCMQKNPYNSISSPCAKNRTSTSPSGSQKMRESGRDWPYLLSYSGFHYESG